MKFQWTWNLGKMVLVMMWSPNVMILKILLYKLLF